ncbi:MAG: hypothetical protein EBZ48_10645 [Proteobacteria bacterium]|nr:hypothetical protein [Pseudomonadota bacterium]
MKRLRKDTGFLVLTLLLAAAIRLDFLIATNWVIDSDEGIVGLMAKHISEGSRFPIFFYGQHYMGSFEAFVAAALFKLFGISSVTLKLAPLLFSLAMVPLMYKLGRAIGGTYAARTAALLWALPPSPLVVWSSMARGGFIEIVWIGAVATLLTVRWLRAEIPQQSTVFWIGATLGFGWWVNNQSIYFIVPIGFVVTCRVLEPHRRRFASLVRAGLLGLSGFFLGGLPFWIYNLQNSFVSFEIINRAHASQVTKHLSGLFSSALPMLLGAKRFWRSEEVFPAATVVVLGLYLALALAVMLLRARQIGELLRLRIDRKNPVELFSLMLLTILGAFTLSSFGHLVTAPRYLLPLYLPLFVLIGFLVAKIRPFNHTIARAMPVVLVLIGLASCYLGGRAIPGQPFVTEGQRVSQDHSELITWLREHEIAFVRTNYWIGYRLAFETKEQVKFIRFKEPFDTRIPEYTVAGEKEPQSKVPYVLAPLQAETVGPALRALGYTFTETRLSGYVVLSDIAYKGIDRKPVSAELLRASASDNSEQSPLALDRNPQTRWGSGSPQNPAQWIELRPKRPIPLRGFTLDMRGWETDYARALTVVGIRPDGSQVTLISGDEYKAIHWTFREIEREFTVSFDATPLSAVRFMQIGKDPVFDWSIAEITLWE